MDMESMKSLGMLLGRGAIISGIITLVFMPNILIFMDKLIFKCTKVKHDILEDEITN